jgi:hypothetical protein
MSNRLKPYNRLLGQVSDRVPGYYSENKRLRHENITLSSIFHKFMLQKKRTALT